MINFNKRLSNLKNRRQGTKERALFENGVLNVLSPDPRQQENYEKLAESAGVKYAIGAMSAVDQESTAVSIREGSRVADTLIGLLKTEGIPTSSQLQGSVALDIHIEGYSDVDMLILKEDILLVETPKLDGSPCVCSDPRPMVDLLSELRTTSEEKLKTRYHGANVDCSHNKSISLSGGSLKRKVDIVPACWVHSHVYQRSGQFHHKGVEIYHKADHTLIGNTPFLHIKLVNDRDCEYSGNLKRIIRLMKNLVADMPEYQASEAKALSSYDITAIGYHMNERLYTGIYSQLSLVEKLREYLHLLIFSPELRALMKVPDGSRFVFDSDDKFEALKVLHKEVTDLATSIATILNPFTINRYDPSVLLNKKIMVA